MPHISALLEDKGVEEERRLGYGVIARARKSMTVSWAVDRRVFGNERQMRESLPSRFLAEIPRELVDTASGSLSDIGEKRRYEPDPEYSYSSEEFLRRVRSEPSPAMSTHRRPGASSNFNRPAIKRGSDAHPMLGRKVRHPTDGTGTVVSGEEDEEDRRVCVSVPGPVRKKLLERKPQLGLGRDRVC